METSNMKSLGMNTIKLKIQIAILAMLSLALPPTIPTAHREWLMPWGASSASAKSWPKRSPKKNLSAFEFWLRGTAEWLPW